MNKPNKIIIHHSLTKDSGTVSWEAIRKYHKNKGWQDIGYHYGIELVGNEYKILKGRSENTVGAHTVGQNSNSIGMCLVGNFDVTYPSPKQLNKLKELILDIFSRYGNLPVYTHNHFASYKSCPGKNFPFKSFLDQLENKDNEFELAINKIAENGIISSPDYWLKNDTWKKEYVELLIKKVANYI